MKISIFLRYDWSNCDLVNQNLIDVLARWHIFGMGPSSHKLRMFDLRASRIINFARNKKPLL